MITLVQQAIRVWSPDSARYFNACINLSVWGVLLLTVGLLRGFKMNNCLNVLLNLTTLNKCGTCLELLNAVSGRANTVNKQQLPFKRVPCFSRAREILKWCCCVGAESDLTVIHCTVTFPCCRGCLLSLLWKQLCVTSPNSKQNPPQKSSSRSELKFLWFLCSPIEVRGHQHVRDVLIHWGTSKDAKSNDNPFFVSADQVRSQGGAGVEHFHGWYCIHESSPLFGWGLHADKCAISWKL